VKTNGFSVLLDQQYANCETCCTRKGPQEPKRKLKGSSSAKSERQKFQKQKHAKTFRFATTAVDKLNWLNKEE
jgi:hypothetical protein